MERKIILLVASILILVGLIGLFLRSRLVPTKAGLLVESTPEAQVFLDGEEIGVTPVDIQRRAGEVVVKVIPIANNGPLAPHETKVTLTGGIKTVIRRNFASTDEESSGEVISFEPIGGRSTSLAVVSSPDAAEVFLDGVSQGFAPVRVDLSAGEHDIKVSADGFAQRGIRVAAVSGFKLTLIVKLAQVEKAEEPVEAEKEVFVEITQTPTGFLRVRAQPTTLATEAARVTPGKRYVFVSENEDKTWFEIEYEEGKTGWISVQYAKKIEE